MSKHFSILQYLIEDNYLINNGKFLWDTGAGEEIENTPQEIFESYKQELECGHIAFYSPEAIVVNEITKSPLVLAAITEAVHRYYHDNILLDDKKKNKEALQFASDLLSNLWCLYPNWRKIIIDKGKRYCSAETTNIQVSDKPKIKIELLPHIVLNVHGSVATDDDSNSKAD